MMNDKTIKSNLSPMHVLAVDDSVVDREILAARLNEALPNGSLVLTAAGETDALKILEDPPQKIDCVLLDMYLMDGDGATMASMITTRWPHISVIMITGETDMDAAIGCMQAGAEDFLIKGEYNTRGLYRSMRHAVERHRYREESKRLNAALERERELSRMQKEFIHLVNHEFRTPLAVINGANQLLQVKFPEMLEKGAPQFSKISNAIRRLTALLGHVLRLNQMEDGKVNFKPEPYDLQQQLQRVCQQFNDGFASARIDIRGDVLPADFHGDSELVEFTLTNVISNALKYSESDAVVEIVTRVDARGCELFVIDSGVGMSLATQAKAGQKFFRGDEHSHIEGVGLGVYIAQRFAEYHGGSIIFCSESGAGTAVRIWFPLKQEKFAA